MNIAQRTMSSARDAATSFGRAIADDDDVDVEDHHAAAREWVDALLAGRCTEGDFLTQIMLLLDDEPDLAWEVLGLLDQQHRRGAIGADLFLRVKGRLQQECLGYGTAAIQRGGSAADSPSVPRRIVEPPRHRFKTGDVLKARYRVVEVRARTRASLLIEAFDTARLDLPEVRQRVAITLLSDELSRDIGLVQRIYRLQRLSHPAIPRIFDIDEDDGELFFTTEWMTAIPLQSMLQRQASAVPGLPLAWSVIGAVGGALAYAHAHGVAHGNVNLDHVHVTESGDVHLQGFVLEGEGVPLSAAADRIAFARMAHALLLQCEGPVRAEDTDPAALRRPRALARAHWQLMRSTIQGQDPAASQRLLECLAGETSALRESAEGLHGARESSIPLKVSIAASLLAVAAAVGGYLLTRDAGAAAGERPVPAAADAGSAEPDPQRQPTGDELVAEVDANPGTADSATSATAPPVVLELTRPVVRIAGDQPVARVYVRRNGSLEGPVTFVWSTEPGTAQVNRDFSAVPLRSEVIEDGRRGLELQIPLVKDVARAEARAFYVRIDRAGNGAALGSQTLAQVELVPQ